ncbi:MAG: exonuclease subunit SbcD [Cyanobacteria bacterium P01_D01_bin.128]
MIKLLHLSDIHMGSGFNHGRLNPETGLNTRLEDFVSTLGRCLDRAIAEPVDLVLFSGDAFPDATPPPLVQQAFARQFRRLVDADIPTVLLVGNHDQHSQGQGGASLCIYRTLGVPGFVVGDRLETHLIQTRSGGVQVITLPWLTHSTLLTRPETEGLSLADVNYLLVDRLRVALEGEIRRLNSDLPTVLLGHVMTDTARYGAERFLAVGKGFTVPMTVLARPCFDYVALGHVHKHQILSESPLTLYPGSIERVDFSEEAEEKGYVLIDLEKGRAQAEFCPLPVRRFQTIRCDVSKGNGSQCDASGVESPPKSPQEELLQAIAGADITDAVVRLLYKLRPDQIDQIDNVALGEALAAAHTYTIYPELVSQLARPRLPELGSDSTLEPLAALQTYLANREDLAEIAGAMSEAALTLLDPACSEERESWLDTLPPAHLEMDDSEAHRSAAELAESDRQLRLL